MNYWTNYLKAIPSFSFEFSIKVNAENYKERILEFDSVFLKKGLELGICVFDELESIEAIDRYLSDRKENFWLQPKDNNALNFFDLKQSNSYTGNGVKSMYLPYLESNKIVNKKITSSRHFYDVLSIDGLQDLRENELLEEDWEEKEISIGMHSSSNIWWDEFNLTILNGESWGDRVLFKPPIDNRSCCYRITPRLNSFIYKLSKTSLKFGAKFLFEEHNTKYVKEEGILIDNRIFYQKDIGEGRLDLTEIDKRALIRNQSAQQQSD